MKLYDILFPLKLPPLTYKSNALLKPGMVVRAEIRKHIETGIVVGETKNPPAGGIKEIASVAGDVPLLTPQLFKLISWIAEYYMFGKGIVLKEFLPDEYLKIENRTFTSAAEGFKRNGEPGDAVFEEIKSSIGSNHYSTFLLHSNSSVYDIDLLERLASGLKNIIILCPEISLIEHVYRVMPKSLKDRTSVIHSALTKKTRSSNIEKILTGESDIAIGGRLALLTPFRNPSLIFVMNEESGSYRKEDGLGYNIRDIAVKRGSLEGSTVILTSIAPSLESYQNALAGKYTLLRPLDSTPRPRIRLINMRTSKKANLYISNAVIDKALKALKENRSIGFMVNRKGYSLIRCGDCGYTASCDNCNVPLTFHKKDNILKCYICGRNTLLHETCPECKGANLNLEGTGTEKLEIDLKVMLDIEPLMADTLKSKMYLLEENKQVVIGTKSLARKTRLKERFSLICVLNGDSFFSIPDFRVNEKGFQEIMRLTENIESDGELIIQTRNPGNPIFGFIKNYDFKGFYDNELSERKTLNYPPFSRLAIITSKDESLLMDIKKKITDKNIEALGPVESMDRKGGRLFKLLLKSDNREALRNALNEIHIAQVSIQIDPLTI